MLKFEDLLFNKWILSVTATFQDPNINSEFLNPYKLNSKLSDTSFFIFFENNAITSYAYWVTTKNFLTNFPNSWQPRSFKVYLETTPIEHRIKDDSYLQPIEWVVLRAFRNTVMVWLYLPIFLTDFFKYYPHYKPKPLILEESEFAYLDCWIQILPVFQDLLGHLFINDTPLVEQGFYGNEFLPVSLMPPLEKDINFSKHIREFYFGEASIPEFKDVITLYLNNRLELKKRCEKVWDEDNQLDNKIPVDLAEYFISCFLLKGISKYTLRFVVANLDLSNKNITKVVRDASIKEWNALSDEMKKLYWPEGWLTFSQLLWF